MSPLFPLLCAALAVDPALPNRNPTPQERLQEAKATFDYGNYAAAAVEAQQLLDLRALDRVPDQIEALRLVGLSRFFTGDREIARTAFVSLLSLDPDYQLDAFYVPPQAVAFFEKVRDDNQTLLRPIRERRRAAEEALRREEENRQRQLPPSAPTSTLIRERVDRPSVWIALLPLGAGQFQNDNPGLGIPLAIVEGLGAIASVACYLEVESLRQNDGFFSSANYLTADRLRTVQIATGGGSLLLWALGAAEALWHLKAPSIVRVEGQSPPPARLRTSLSPVPGGAVGSLELHF